MANNTAAKPTDPGAAPFGNFINYYQFNSAEERLRLLPTTTTAEPQTAAIDENVWSQAAADCPATEPYIVLDVGCNAGNFTQLLYRDFLRQHCSDAAALDAPQRAVHILGVDIDAQLIERAREQNQHTANVSYLCADVMDADAAAQIGGHLDAVWPGRRRFNAVFCMSVSMWIHLNHGDEGLAAFLRRVSEWSALLVIEPQPWKCYGTAVRRQRRAAGAGGRPFERFDGLRWRRDVEERIDGYLVAECGRRRVCQTVPTKWERRIALYVKDA